jgi:flagellar hook-basal body complex protein FliE
MTTPIPTSIPLPGVAWPAMQAPPNVAPATGFQELLSKTWSDTARQNDAAQRAVETSLAGEDLAMVETFTALREADLSLRLMLQIRNKLVDAYQELQQLRF